MAKFLPSIDHEVLLGLIPRRTPPDLHWLAKRTVQSGGRREAVHFHLPGGDLLTPLHLRYGLRIGNLTSQGWANAMLSPMDHFTTGALAERRTSGVGELSSARSFVKSERHASLAARTAVSVSC